MSPHTAQTQNSQLPLSDHCVASLSDPFGRKVALNTPIQCAAYSTVAFTFYICVRCNKQVALHENRIRRNGVHRKTKSTQYSTPPTHCADLLADRQSECIQPTHNQSEYPMAQTADSQPPQTSHVESEQTTSTWLRKLPKQLNTPNRFVPDLVQVSLNA